MFFYVTLNQNIAINENIASYYNINYYNRKRGEWGGPPRAALPRGGSINSDEMIDKGLKKVTIKKGKRKETAHLRSPGRQMP